MRAGDLVDSLQAARTRSDWSPSARSCGWSDPDDLQYLDESPIVAPNNAQPKSPARQQCEANAAQQYQSALNNAGQAFTGRGMLRAGAAGFVTGGLAGCVAGAIPTAWLGPEVAGPACAAVGLTAGTVSGVAAIAFDQAGSFIQALRARSAYQQQMQGCSAL